jgi:hypothetical protein
LFDWYERCCIAALPYDRFCKITIQIGNFQELIFGLKRTNKTGSQGCGGGSLKILIDVFTTKNRLSKEIKGFSPTSVKPVFCT